MTFATLRACAALFALAAIAAAPLPAAAARNYYFYPADQAGVADATIQAEQPYPYENREPIDTALAAVAVDGPTPQFVELKKMRTGPTELSAVHVLPGTYRIRVACESGTYNDTFVSEPVAIEAGRDYFVECRGQTRDQARVSVTSQSAELHGVRGIRARTFEVPAGTSVEAVSTALTSALKGRGWEITGSTPGRIDAALHVREHVAVIRIDYDAHQATFNYVDSTNLEFMVQDGVTSVHRNYYNWVNYLGSDLLTYLRGEVPVI
jgi:hypothetical protein